MEPYPSAQDRTRHRRLAAIGLVGFLLHAGMKIYRNEFPEMLWGCNVSSLALILGFAFEWPVAVGAAFLWRLVIGEPGFMAGVFYWGGRYSWTTVFVHGMPTLFAYLFLRRSGLPRSAWFWAWIGTGVLVPLSFYFTPPHLNVNLVFTRLDVLARHFPGVWEFRIVAGLLVGAGLVGLDALFGRLLGRPRPEAA